jgi:hypothetical protein
MISAEPEAGYAGNRWVLVRRFDGNRRIEAFFSTDPAMAPEELLRLFALRWQMEVTFAEVRRHLGAETQRQWAGPAMPERRLDQGTPSRRYGGR